MNVVAVEDELSEAVARRLISEAGYDPAASVFVGKCGAGYLKANMRKYSEIGQRGSVFILTDLDSAVCAPRLVAAWLRGVRRTPGLILRVAVREIEAWLLADRKGMALFLGISEAKIERVCEALPDPKKYVLELARYAPARLRNGLIPRRGVAASQGFEYNMLLTGFVEDIWSSKRAAENCDSLKRAIERIRAHWVASDSERCQLGKPGRSQ